MDGLEESLDTVLQEDLQFIADKLLPYEKLNGKSVLVTGATGLIGVSLIRAMLCICRVRNIDITIYAMIRNEKKADDIYKRLKKRKNLKFIVHDITEPLNLHEKVDYIIHCASITASKVMVEKPVEVLDTAILGTKNLLQLAKEQSVESFVYISSMEMYGKFDEPNCEVTEEKIGYINPLSVRSNYPESKRLCENMCIAYMFEYGVPVKIARLAQTFGAGILKEENRVFAQFAKSAILGNNIILHTTGLSEGNYCYTRDAVTAIFTIMLFGTNGEAYNVANPKAHMTIRDMAFMVANELAEGKIKVEFDIPKSNIYGYAQDTKMILNAEKLCKLGWKPEVDIKQMYERLISSLKLQGDIK